MEPTNSATALTLRNHYSSDFDQEIVVGTSITLLVVSVLALSNCIKKANSSRDVKDYFQLIVYCVGGAITLLFINIVLQCV